MPHGKSQRFVRKKSIEENQRKVRNEGETRAGTTDRMKDGQNQGRTESRTDRIKDGQEAEGRTHGETN